MQQLRDTIQNQSKQIIALKDAVNGLVSVVNGLSLQTDEVFKFFKQNKIKDNDEIPLSDLDLSQLNCPLSTVEAVERFEEQLNDSTLFNEIVSFWMYFYIRILINNCHSMRTETLLFSVRLSRATPYLPLLNRFFE